MMMMMMIIIIIIIIIIIMLVLMWRASCFGSNRQVVAPEEEYLPQDNTGYLQYGLEISSARCWPPLFTKAFQGKSSQSGDSDGYHGSSCKFLQYISNNCLV
jgi:hypothetical protein